LPPTLAHQTPHGAHLIYRTPDGWKGRAWVGKAPGNPVPAGVDLRMPGQILMAAPSIVPGQDGPASYGPVTEDPVALLPAAYVAAWTPPQPQTRAPAAPVPVPAASADRAAKYVRDAMARIAGDLASRDPGGRNAAAYAAGLKAGSLLGAARGTPGAEHAAWTDEQAEQALLEAARRNGYAGKDGEAEALRAIRSGLRNGLRAPRTLPDFSARRTTPASMPRPQPAVGPARRPSASQARDRPAAPAARSAGRWQDMVPDDIRREVEAADTAAAVRRRAAVAAHQQAIAQHDRAPSAQTAADVERTRAIAQTAHEAYTRDGRHIVGRHHAAMLRWAASITAQREQAAAEPAKRPPDALRTQADTAAEAAIRAYRAGDLDEARRKAEEAAASDPFRASLWQQYRDQIAARRAVLASRQAYHDTGGDWRHAERLLEETRQIDAGVRGRAIWNQDLPAPSAVVREHAGTRAGSARPADDQHRNPQQEREPGWSSLPLIERQGGVPAIDPGRWPAPNPRSTPQPGSAGPHTGQTAQPVPPPARERAVTPPQPRQASPKDPDTGRESRTTGDAAAGGPGGPRGTPQVDPSSWPAPNPRTAAEPASPERIPRQQTASGASGEPVAGAYPGHEAPGDDWRDMITNAARDRWQPRPIQPYNPAVFREPQTATPEGEIEADP
jgi:hypothetical protein